MRSIVNIVTRKSLVVNLYCCLTSHVSSDCDIALRFSRSLNARTQQKVDSYQEFKILISNKNSLALSKKKLTKTKGISKNIFIACF